MPGSYAHITSVNEASEKRRLLKIEGFPREAIDAANLHLKFLELGCISPDYPYLDIASGDSKSWADAMQRFVGFPVWSQFVFQRYRVHRKRLYHIAGQYAGEKLQFKGIIS